MKRRKGLPRAGFTLIELMIVITIILILIGMAAQRYEKSVQHAREATMKQDLWVMRQAIDKEPLTIGLPMAATLGVTAVATLVIGVFPEPFIQAVNWTLGLVRNPAVANLVR